MCYYSLKCYYGDLFELVSMWSNKRLFVVKTNNKVETFYSYRGESDCYWLKYTFFVSLAFN